MQGVSNSTMQYSLSVMLDKETGASQFSEQLSTIAARKYLTEKDANADGVLSQDEIDISEEAYARLDADEDGSLSEEEISTGLVGSEGEIYNYFAKTDSRWARISALSTMLKTI